MWKHKNFINLQLYAFYPANVIINWDSNITKVVGKLESDIEYSNGESYPGDDEIESGKSYTFEVTLNSGYVLDTVTLSNDDATSSGTLVSQTDTTFVIATPEYAGINQNITLTSKQGGGGHVDEL